MAKPVEQQLAEAIEILRTIEWRANGSKCPFCFGWDVVPEQGETPNRHTDWCKLAAALEGAATKGQDK